ALSRPDPLRDVYHVRLRLVCGWAAQRDLTLTTVCRLFQSQRQVCFLISSRHRPSCRIPSSIALPLGCPTSRCIAKELFKKTTEPTSPREHKIFRSAAVEPDVLIARWRGATTLFCRLPCGPVTVILGTFVRILEDFVGLTNVFKFFLGT